MADNTTNSDFEQKLWLTADKMRSNMDAAEYKHVVLGLIFLKYISDAYKDARDDIVKEDGGPEEKDEYLARLTYAMKDQYFNNNPAWRQDLAKQTSNIAEAEYFI